MKRFQQLWMANRPESKLSEKQLVAQKANILKKKMLSDLEIEEVKRLVTDT